MSDDRCPVCDHQMVLIPVLGTFAWRGDDGSRSECIKKGHCGCGATIADICDAIAGDPPSTPSGRHDDWQHGWQDGAMECAATIRARAPAPPEGEPDYEERRAMFIDFCALHKFGLNGWPQACLDQFNTIMRQMYHLGHAARQQQKP